MRTTGLLKYLFIGCSLITGMQASAQSTTQESSSQQLMALVKDVYQYAYPIVLMDITKRQATNVPNSDVDPQRAPINQFAHYRAYPDAKSKDVVRFNFDTLYSLAWVDAKDEPIVLSVPDGKGRYYLTPMLDMWTDVFAVPGTRTTGGKAGKFLLTAPGWSGTVPDGLELIRMPTSVVWIIGRTQTNGVDDYANVHKMQDRYKLEPLSLWGKGYTPPTNVPVDKTVDNKTPPLMQINKMSGVDVFAYFSKLLKTYPPHANDYPILHRMKALGLERGKDFSADGLDPQLTALINTAAKSAQEDLKEAVASAGIGRVLNGWNWTDDLGTYGTGYRKRALVALAGLGANLPQDAIYLNGFADANGKAYDGKNKYTLRFEKGQLPPAGAFWSLTMYDKDGFQVANEINRFAIGDRDKLKFGEDGSLTLYMQHDHPADDKKSNWLPSPAGSFQIMLRVYAPQPALLNGVWQPPAAKLAQ